MKQHRYSVDLTKKASPIKMNSKHNIINMATPNPKFIRKSNRYNSSLTALSGSPTLIHHVTNHSMHSFPTTVNIIQKCLDVLQVIKLRSSTRLNKEKKQLIHLRQCTAPNVRQSIITEIIDHLQPKSRKSVEAEIEIVISQLTEEKKQKEMAIDQRKNLVKQQEWQIQQLVLHLQYLKKSRINQYS